MVYSSSVGGSPFLFRHFFFFLHTPATPLLLPVDSDKLPFLIHHLC